MGDPADLLLALGSGAGLREPVVTGVVAGHRPTRASIGDFNGDGLADIAWDDRTGPLRATRSWFEIVDGSRGRMRSSVQPDVGMLGSCAVTSQAAVVDWNGDGYSDLIFSVLFGCIFSRPVEASILLGYSGSPTGIATAPQWALRLSERFTHSLVTITAGLSDLDDDGYGDISVVSRFSGNGTSSVPTEHAILHGTTGGEPRIERIPEPTPVRGAWRDGVPASIGDVDGDGHQDFLLRLNHSSPVYIYRSSIGVSSPSSILTDPIGGGNFGFYFSSGDVNGDGLSDVIIASQLATTMERDGMPINEGRVYVFPGSSGGVVAQPFWLERAVPYLGGPTRYLFGGNSVCPGDLNGDGIDDITMSDSLDSQLCVHYGRIGFANGSPDLCLDGVMPPGTANSY
ncbi:MAG: VCBS repeat-containing protein [Deltaproteobacteria bacterium]|nr:VCBS repeat-containing protein [Deltaproteobacteria bacterium]